MLKSSLFNLQSYMAENASLNIVHCINTYIHGGFIALWRVERSQTQAKIQWLVMISILPIRSDSTDLAWLSHPYDSPRSIFMETTLYTAD